jgi:hypothetical protein
MKADIELMAIHSGIIAHVPADMAELVAFAKAIAADCAEQCHFRAVDQRIHKPTGKGAFDCAQSIRARYGI